VPNLAAHCVVIIARPRRRRSPIRTLAARWARAPSRSPRNNPSVFQRLLQPLK
jgi:hypothetical protein